MSAAALIWRFIRDYALRYRLWFAVGVVLLLVTNLLSIAIAKCLEGALGALTSGGAFTWIAWLLASSVSIVFVRTASRLAIFIPGREAEFAVRMDYFRALMRQAAPFFRRLGSGDLLSRGSNDIQFIRALIGFAGLQLLNVLFAVPLNLWMMFQTSVTLTVACVAPLAVALVVMWRSSQALMREMRASQEELARLSGTILEVVSGVRAIQAAGAERTVVQSAAEANTRYLVILERMAGIRSFLLPVVGVVGSLAVVVLIGMGGRMVAEGALHYGSILAYTVYVANVVSAFTGLGWVLSVIQRGQVSLTRVFDILDAPPPADGDATLAPRAPTLACKDLSFRYSEDGPLVLSGLSFEVPAGVRLGLFGATGSGKSTLLRVFARLDEPPAGAVFVDGTDVTTLSRAALRRHLAVVPQTAWLFSRSLADNVALGTPGGTPANVDAALRLAAVDQDAARLPDGIHTLVGERGVTLSGGQRQRVAIARAAVRAGWVDDVTTTVRQDDGSTSSAHLVLLDDALSAVDHDAERRLVDMLASRRGDATVVIASHRVSVLRRCDYVLVLEAGRALAFGPPDALERQDGPYADACRAEDAGNAGTSEALSAVAMYPPAPGARAA